MESSHALKSVWADLDATALRGLLVHNNQPAFGAAEARSAPRSNMYIAAILSWEGSSAPTKIRNMSAAGALLEAARLPPSGTPVRLIRGSLRAAGTIAWVSEGRCGVHFASLVSVRGWMAPTKNCEQMRVDETVSILRAGAVPLAQRQQHSSEIRTAPTQLADDLSDVTRLIRGLARDMAGDDQVLTKYGNKLQIFDLAIQTLDAAAALLTSDGRSDADAIDRLRNLRASRAQVR